VDGDDLPVGRRVARWRVRRRMSQQVFADRLGKSKSWVDKVERGVRTLDRYSVIQEIAEVLRVDPALLLGTRLPSWVDSLSWTGWTGCGPPSPATTIRRPWCRRRRWSGTSPTPG
jgi:hypothetical protein